MRVRISLGTKFRLKQTILIIWTKFFQKGYFQSKAEKLNITIEFCIFELVQVPNFKINWQFWFFGPNLQKRAFVVEIGKCEHNHWILHIQIRRKQLHFPCWRWCSSVIGRTDVQKNIPQHLFGATHLVRTYLMTDAKICG